MKLLKLIGLFFIISLTFFYTDELIEVSLYKDPLMDSIKEYAKNNNEPPTNASTNESTIISGNTGKYVDELSSYKKMKKFNYFIPSLLVWEEVYPEISIYNNYHKYIINGNPYHNNISLIYIVNNPNSINSINDIVNKYQININLFINHSILLESINLIKSNNILIYNYGEYGVYSKDNLLLGNNIINNKTNNNSTFCLFLKENITSLNNCANHKMLSILPTKTTYFKIKDNLHNGNIYLITNLKELPNIIEYIKLKGYHITSLDETIKEAN